MPGTKKKKTEVYPHHAGFVERLSHQAVVWSGSAWAFGLACLLIIGWALTGPIFGFSDTWQMVINTSTTIITFLMVFLIQRSQNKEVLALHLKLNEIVAALQGASNRMVCVEDLTEEEVENLHRHYHQLAALAARHADITESHSIEEADKRHRSKTGAAPASRANRRKRTGKNGRHPRSHEDVNTSS